MMGVSNSMTTRINNSVASRKVKMSLPKDPANPCLGKIPKGLTYVQWETLTRITRQHYSNGDT